MKNRIKQRIIKCCKNKFDRIFGRDKDVKFGEPVTNKQTKSREGQLFCEFHATMKDFAHCEEYKMWYYSVVGFQVENGEGIALFPV